MDATTASPLHMAFDGIRLCEGLFLVDNWFNYVIHVHFAFGLASERRGQCTSEPTKAPEKQGGEEAQNSEGAHHHHFT